MWWEFQSRESFNIEFCIWSVFQLDFEIFSTIARFIKISSGHSLIIKLIFIKKFQDNLRNRWANVLRPVPSWITVDIYWAKIIWCKIVMVSFLKCVNLKRKVKNQICCITLIMIIHHNCHIYKLTLC